MRVPSLRTLRGVFVVIGVLAVCVGIGNVVKYDWRSLVAAEDPYDFDLNWVAAHRLVAREPLYDRAASRADGVRLIGPEMRETNQGPFSSYIGLPATALLYTPFTALDSRPAAQAFRLVDALGIFIALLITLFALPSQSRLPAGLIGTGAMLVSIPVLRSISLGQVDGFLMIGLALALVGVAHERWGLAGIGLGVATLLKFSPILLIVYLALRRKWRAVWVALATMVGLLVLAAAIGRPADLFDWIRIATQEVANGARNVDNQSVPAALARLFGGFDDILVQAPLGAWRVVSLVIAGIGLAALWWFRRRRPVDPLELGVLVLVALLAGPISWDHYMTWSLVVLVLLADPARFAHRSWLEVWLLLGALGTAILTARLWPSYPLPSEVRGDWFLRVVSTHNTAAVLVLLMVALRLLFSPARLEAEPSAITDPGETRVAPGLPICLPTERLHDIA